MTELETQWGSLVMSLAAHRPADRSAPADPALDPGRGAATPVALLTGFLGAGKSTLLTSLLSEGDRVGRVRAVVNDIGALRFDPSLVASSDEAGIELTNGCGCCVAGAAAEVAEALDAVAIDADLVVLEASGVADPAALAQVVTARPALELDRVVAVVDARSVERLLGLAAVGPLLRRQLATATVVVLSHVDRVAVPEAERLVDVVAELAPGTPILASTIDDPASRALTPAVAVGAAAPGREPDQGLPVEELVVRTLDQRIDVDGVALTELLSARPDALLRGKGRLLVDGVPALVQFTPTTWSVVPAGPGPVGLTVVAAEAEVVEPLARLVVGRTNKAGPPEPDQG